MYWVQFTKLYITVESSKYFIKILLIKICSYWILQNFLHQTFVLYSKAIYSPAMFVNSLKLSILICYIATCWLTVVKVWSLNKKNWNNYLLRSAISYQLTIKAITKDYSSLRVLPSPIISHGTVQIEKDRGYGTPLSNLISNCKIVWTVSLNMDSSCLIHMKRINYWQQHRWHTKLLQHLPQSITWNWVILYAFLRSTKNTKRRLLCSLVFSTTWWASKIMSVQLRLFWNSCWESGSID